MSVIRSAPETFCVPEFFLARKESCAWVGLSCFALSPFFVPGREFRCLWRFGASAGFFWSFGRCFAAVVFEV